MRAPRPFVRIVGGKWRGRRLPVPAAAPFRPSGDRVRESLFNCLGQRLDGWACLDLFAGTGAMGLEAASRGATKIVFVERDPETLRRVSEAASALFGNENDGEFETVRGDVFAWMQNAGEGRKYDLIFADPPFADYRDDASWRKLLSALSPRLAADGRVYCESDRFFPLPDGWLAEKERTAGRAKWRIIRREQQHCHRGILSRRSRDKISATSRASGIRAPARPSPSIHSGETRNPQQ